MSTTPTSSKQTNNEIVKALIVLTQDFFNHNPGPVPGSDQGAFGITIDEGNLVDRISMALNSYRRQKDRMSDLLDNMRKIANGG